MTVEFTPKRSKPEFYSTGVPCVRGHMSPRYARFGGCVTCVAENNQRSLEKGKQGRNERLRKWVSENREYSNARRKAYSHQHPERVMVAAAKKAAKQFGVPFDIRWQDISIPEKCPVLGIPMHKGIDARSGSSPSLDRIVPERGYVKGNIIVVSWRVNRIKCDASVTELRRIAEFYERLTNLSEQ